MNVSFYALVIYLTAAILLSFSVPVNCYDFMVFFSPQSTPSLSLSYCKVVARCAACGDAIGGHDHQALPDNERVGELEGGAWAMRLGEH